MPRSALATGLADFCLPPEDMPARLLAFLEHTRKTTYPEKGGELWSPDVLGGILKALRLQSGYDFEGYKHNTLKRRLERRMAVQNVSDPRSYLECLEGDPAEADALFRDLLIGVTRFFRDSEAFQVLEEEIFPGLVRDREGTPIRIWVAGCSTGEEAYSLAILLQEQKEKLKQDFRTQIFATDLDPMAIDSARAGIFGPAITNDVSPERLARHFTYQPETGCYAIKKSIRDLLVFSEHDLTRDPPFSRIDLFSCRNVLIYMNAELHERVLSLAHYALSPNGYLFLGSAETVSGSSQLFAPMFPKHRIYRRKLGRSPGRVGMNAFRPRELTTHQPVSAKSWNPRSLIETHLIAAFEATAVLVDIEGNIIYIHGQVGDYLETTPGYAEMNIVKMARPGLRRTLQIALRESAKSKEAASRSGLQLSLDGGGSPFRLTVLFIPPDSNQPPLQLVVFQRSQQEPPPTDAEPAMPATEASLVVEKLRAELRRKDEYLDATTEALETTNEELRSSNEELQSVNEELQSTNEELETSKEELQSVNEELTTVNTELQVKLSDLTRVNNDMNNLLAGTGVGTVFVDHKLTIMRFTPAVTRVLNLIPSDVGRPVGHISSNLLRYDSLISDVQGVLDTLIPKEFEVEDNAHHWFLLRIHPYRTLDNVIEGAVITFIEITEMKLARDAIEASEHWLRTLAESLPQLVWTSSAEGMGNYFGPQWGKLTKLPISELRGLGWVELVHPDDRVPVLRAWNEGIQKGYTFKLEFRLYLESLDGYRLFRSTVVPLPKGLGSSTGWFATSEPVGVEEVGDGSI
ncbi:MAG: CheR family methyltransferase [Vulcanimicrobiota bacterium]